jgi:hypothetical protein
MVKIYRITTNYTKWSQVIPNGRKIFQMVIKYPNIFLSNALQNLPKVGYLGRKKTSGNPDWQLCTEEVEGWVAKFGS